jgi:hypothetical protein
MSHCETPYWATGNWTVSRCLLRFRWIMERLKDTFRHGIGMPRPTSGPCPALVPAATRGEGVSPLRPGLLYDQLARFPGEEEQAAGLDDN